MKRLVREPLVHLFLVGAVLLVIWTRVGRPAVDEPGRIVVKQSDIARLAAGFDRVHGRPASAAELDGLIRDHVREEVYYREALKLGLDRDDAVIRNRLRTKMELIADDIAAGPEPSDEALRDYLQAHPEPFRIEARISFDQLYLDPERHRARLADDGARLLEQLSKGGDRADLSALGDSFLLGRSFAALPRSAVTALFGEPFATALMDAPLDRWSGPIESGYGAHLVRVTQRAPGRLPDLEEVRDAVRREWENSERQNAHERFYAGLRERYAVTFEPPEPGRGDEALAAARPVQASPP